MPSPTKCSERVPATVCYYYVWKGGTSVALRPHKHLHVKTAVMEWKVLEKGAFRLPGGYSENSLNFHSGFWKVASKLRQAWGWASWTVTQRSVLTRALHLVQCSEVAS